MRDRFQPFAVLVAAMTASCLTSACSGLAHDPEHERMENVGTEANPMYMWVDGRWCDNSQGITVAGCSPPYNMVNVCWESVYTTSQYATARSIVQDEIYRYERYGRVNLVWSSSQCSWAVPTKDGIHMNFRMTGGGGNTKQRTYFPGDGSTMAQVTVPDCNMAGSGYGPVQSWVTPEQCLRIVTLHEFGHALGYLHDTTSPQSNENCGYSDDRPPSEWVDTGSDAHVDPNARLTNLGENSQATDDLSRMNTCGGITQAESIYWSQLDLNPIEIAAIQRAYGRRIPGTLVTPGAQCAASHADASGDETFLWDCDEDPSGQVWQWLPQSNDIGIFRMQLTNLCLNAKSDGSHATVATCSGSSSTQRFELRNMLVRGWGGLCLHWTDPNTLGSAVDVRTCDGSDPNQRWTYWRDPAVGDELRFGDGSTNKCVHMGAANGDAATVTTCHPYISQLFGYTADEQIQQTTSHKCLDINGVWDGDYLNGIGYPQSGSAVQTWDCVSSQFNQKWNFTGQVYNPASGKCLRRSNGGVPGSTIFLSSCTTSTGSSNADWDYYPVVYE